MFRCDSSTFLIFVFFLLYFDATIHAERLDKLKTTRNISATKNNFHSTSGKYRSKPLHDVRIERLIAGSEKFLRTSSSSDDREKMLSTRRENSRRIETKRRFENIPNKNRPTEKNYKNQRYESHEQTGLLNMRKKLSIDPVMRRNQNIKSISGCSSRVGKNPKGCLGSRIREKRETGNNSDSTSKLPGNCTPCLVTFPFYYWPAFWFIG